MHAGAEDLMMPGLSGFDVLQAMQKKTSLLELPILIVSAGGLSNIHSLNQSIVVRSHNCDFGISDIDRYIDR